MEIFITGGTGFIGSYITIELLNRGHNLTVLTRNINKVPSMQKLNNLTLVESNLADSDLLGKLIKGKDVCIHVALNYTKASGSEVLIDDTLPTVLMADLAAQNGVKHFIYTSSTACNDNLYMLPKAEIEEPIKTVRTSTKPHPATFYGATKAASEFYLIALSHQTKMRINIVRPGYTFGNPVIDGGSTQGDTRFRDIAKAAVNNIPVRVTKYDGTQFIWAGDLAKLYLEVLFGDFNRRTYFGLSKDFISWERIAKETIKRSGSKSHLVIEDKGYDEDPVYFDVSDMERDYNLIFDPWKHIKAHIDYYLKRETMK